MAQATAPSEPEVQAQLMAMLQQVSPTEAIEVEVAPRRAARPRREPLSRRLTRVAGLVLTSVGVIVVLFLVYLLVVTRLTDTDSQRRLLVKYRARIATGLPLPARVPLVKGAPVALLEVPKLGLSKVVTEGTDPDALKHGPGHYRTSSLPGQPGNAVLAGRRTTYGGAFRRVASLHRGDRIVVTTLQGRFTYKVVRTARVKPGEADVLSPTDDSRLTLITSDPAYTASGRRAVVARLDGRPAARLQTTPAAVADDELGLSGDRGALALVVVWAELLIVTLVAAAFLYRRWARGPTYLLTTPVIVALLFLLFENFDRLLPATL
jgi:sortase A